MKKFYQKPETKIIAFDVEKIANSDDPDASDEVVSNKYGWT